MTKRAKRPVDHKRAAFPKRIEQLTLQTLKTNSDLAIRAARQRGGVRVVDGLGRLLFHLTIPTTPLPE
jgi:hypothetical protein